MTLRLSVDPPFVCPDCGGSIALDPRAECPIEIARCYHVRTDPIVVKVLVRRIAMCTACEWTIEL